MPPGKLGRQFRASGEGLWANDKGAIGIANVPLGPFRVVGIGRFFQGITIIDRSILGAAALGTPATGGNRLVERGIKRGAVDAGLSARNQANDAALWVRSRSRGDDGGRSGQEQRHQQEHDGKANGTVGRNFHDAPISPQMGTISLFPVGLNLLHLRALLISNNNTEGRPIRGRERL